MLLVDPAPTIKFDGQKMRTLLKPYLITAMEAATDEQVAAMKRHVNDTTYGGAPGKPEWRGEIDHELQRIYVKAVDEFIEGAAGVGYRTAGEFVRLMLVAYGSGDKAMLPGVGSLGQSPIEYGPYGRQVWDDDLVKHHSSESTRTGLMPDAFNQAGNMFPTVAVEEVKKTFTQIAERALNNLPPTLLQGCFTQ